MRTIWIAGFAILMTVCALLVTSAAGAEGTPPIKAIVWLDAVKYGNGETATIKYLVTIPAQITLTITKPDGTTVNIGPKPAQAGTVLTEQVQSSAPAGTRQVTLTAKAGGNTATASTSYEATGGLPQGLVAQNLGQEQPGDQGQQGQQQNFVQDQGQMVDQGMNGDQGQMPPADQGQGFAGDQGQGQNEDMGEPLATG